ncbi:MAG: hypothetical protein M3Q30_03645 [Actinomycetota bacterium]|nr:hypothetical protein [Actinomycetota bacterium]
MAGRVVMGSVSAVGCGCDRMVVEPGGTLRPVEELFSVERADLLTLWAKFDCAVVDSALALLEVIDFTFGALRVATPEELASSIGARD